MSRFKAAFFDIDGTLLSHRTGKVPESTVRALTGLRENGIRVVMASGRHPTEVEQINIDTDYFDEFITTNGQILLDHDRNVIATNPIPEDKIGILVDAFHEKKIALQFNSVDDLYMSFVDDRVRQVLADIHTPVHKCRDYRGEQIFQVVAYPTENDQEWIDSLTKDFHVTRWHANGIDIIPANGGKGWGMEAYLSVMGFSREETIAFGDGENDLEMIEFAGCGIAMGNSAEVLKEAADYVTGDIDEDGLYDACVKFGLL